MESALYYLQYPPPPPCQPRHKPPPFSSANQILPKQDVDAAVSSMPDLTLKRIASASNNTLAIGVSLRRRFHVPYLFRFRNTTSDAAMGDEAKRRSPFNGETSISTVDGKEDREKKESEKSSPPPPPPPEKPSPGDCCGSGCVRCVWDVYYEELEDYNKLYKSNANSGSKPC